MVEALRFSSMEQIKEMVETGQEEAIFEAIFTDHKQLVSYLLCCPATENCYLGFCGNCPAEDKFLKLFQCLLGNDIQYNTWENNDIVTKIESNDEFTEKFKVAFHKFVVHDHLYKKQKDFIRELRDGPLDNGRSAMLTVDFGENYSFFIQDAVQSHHWNNKQATICPFVLHYKDTEAMETKYKTYFIISDEMSHDASSVHTFKERVVKKIKEDHPEIKHIYYVSDGAGSQFKNFKNIGNLAFHEEDFGLPATWIFTATGHGKSTCDGMSAVVKRSVRLKSLKENEVINSAKRMFDVAQNTLVSSTLEFFFVSEAEVKTCLENLLDRYRRLNKIPGIRQNHHFGIVERNLEMKRHSYAENSCMMIILAEDDMATPENLSPNTSVDVEMGDFIAIRVNNSYQIGMVMESIDNADYFTLRTMKRSGKGGLSFT